MKKSRLLATLIGFVLCFLPSPILAQEVGEEEEIPADHRTYIRLTPVSSVGVSKDYQVKEGDSALTIYMNDSSKGTYLVSLLHDGKVVSSRQITRK